MVWEFDGSFCVCLVCVVLCCLSCLILFFRCWARPVGRALFRWFLYAICCVFLFWCLGRFLEVGGMMLWLIVFGQAYFVLLISFIMFLRFICLFDWCLL